MPLKGIPLTPTLSALQSRRPLPFLVLPVCASAPRSSSRPSAARAGAQYAAACRENQLASRSTGSRIKCGMTKEGGAATFCETSLADDGGAPSPQPSPHGRGRSPEGMVSLGSPSSAARDQLSTGCHHAPKDRVQPPVPGALRTRTHRVSIQAFGRLPSSGRARERAGGCPPGLPLFALHIVFRRLVVNFARAEGHLQQIGRDGSEAADAAC